MEHFGNAWKSFASRPSNDTASANQYVASGEFMSAPLDGSIKSNTASDQTSQ